MSRALQSIAVIPDGNRRYASRNGLPLQVAYAKGFQKVNDVLEWAAEEKVKRMSFWALSLENYSRCSSLELQVLFRLMKSKMDEALGSKQLKDNDVKIKFFGKLELLPANIKKLVGEIEGKTQDRKQFELQVGIAYSGQDEIMRASQLIAREIAQGKLSSKQLESMDSSQFNKYLYTSFSPDLVIRTGGVHRLSGFLPFQSAYSEYYFSPKLWPEFSRQDFSKAIDFYAESERRFGK